MKIVHVFQTYDYGKPELGFSNAYCNYYGCLANMKDRGVEVIAFSVNVVKNKKAVEEVSRKLRELVFQEKPEAIFFGVGPGMLKRELIQEITEKSGAVTFKWSFDDHWAFFKSGKHNAFLFHWVFTTDPLAPKKYRKIGYQNAVFMPQCYNYFLYKPLDLPKIYDVSFVGRPHGIRDNLIKKLKQAGITVECFGDGWSSGRISDEEMIKIFCQSKINLNFSESSGSLLKQVALIFFRRDVYRKLKVNSPAKWYDNFQMLLGQKRKQIKGRVFKIVGCRGFLLTGRAEGMEELYRGGQEVEYFAHFDELVRKIHYYLGHEEEREKIAKAGWERSLRDHTCEKRFQEMFEIMGLTEKI